MCYDRTLVDDNKILFYPHGGCWIPNTGDQRNRPHVAGIHQKHRMASIIASDKTHTAGHQLRHTIVERYRQLTAYGPRYVALDYKENALMDFMFSVVVENSQFDDYFTEKLVDCFAVGAIPIYWGTKNIGRYFNADGVLSFNNLSELDTIIAGLSSELYAGHLQAVQDNFNRHAQYRVPEDWIFEQYPYLFKT